jgi:hypothetical protein
LTIARLNKKRPVGEPTGPANFLSLFFGGLELEQSVDSEGVPPIVISYTKATGSLAIIKILLLCRNNRGQ